MTRRTRRWVAAAAAALAITTTAPAANAAGWTPGWRQVYSEGFNTTAAAGAPFLAAYAASWCPYNNTPATPIAALSASNSVMHIRVDGKSGAAGYFRAGGICRSGMIYGRWSVRFRYVGAIGYGGVFMLWPTSQAATDGEVDWPEMFGHRPVSMYANVHVSGDSCATDRYTGQPNCGASAGFQRLADRAQWHTTTIEWVPGHVRMFLDDKLMRDESRAQFQPRSTPHRLTFQTQPDPSMATHTAGDIQIAWAAAWVIA